MKKTVTLPVVFSLLTQACGTIPDDPIPARPAAAAAARAQGTDTLENTLPFEEAEVLAALARQIREAKPFDPGRAARCLAIEAARPAVAEACLLAWAATGQGSSPAASSLDQALRERSGTTRGYALAAVKHPSLVAQLSSHELLVVLSQLSKEPSWLRADAAARWLASHPTTPSRDRYNLWTLTAFDENTADPASAEAAMRLARALDPGREAEVYSRYCAPGEAMLVKVRCLRFLSALVDPRGGRAAEPATLRAWLRPQLGAWPLFEIEFPERALLLTPFRN